MPIDYANYPANWKTEIRPAIIKRAENRCEECGVKNKAIGYRRFDGSFREVADSTEWTGRKTIIRIVLTVSHTDHDITNNGEGNLRALCQRCHLSHDTEHHKASRLRGVRDRAERSGQMDLFGVVGGDGP